MEGNVFLLLRFAFLQLIVFFWGDEGKSAQMFKNRPCVATKANMAPYAATSVEGGETRVVNKAMVVAAHSHLFPDQLLGCFSVIDGEMISRLERRNQLQCDADAAEQRLQARLSALREQKAAEVEKSKKRISEAARRSAWGNNPLRNRRLAAFLRESVVTAAASKENAYVAPHTQDALETHKI